MNNEEAIDYIIDKLQNGGKNLKVLKNEVARKFKLKQVLKNSEIIERIKERKIITNFKLLKKPMRTLSGVTPVAVMIKPEKSCLYKCIFCPFTGRAAKSYTGDEPAARRSIDNGFDPYKQVKMRLNQFNIGGHSTDKCEVIVMGGTFLAMDEEYKNYFIKNIYDACNCKKSTNIKNAKKINETAEHRIVGLTIETRPDVCTTKHIDEILEFGATRIELGVQNPDDEIYKITKRGHLTKHVVESTKNLKDACFKIVYHLMPGQPGSNREKDIEMVKKVFENPDFKPDMLKIYPTLVIPKTELYTMMHQGKYTPYTSEQAAEIISEFYRYIPKYVRVMRIQRDIPATNIAEGVKKSNLREMVESKMREKGIVPKEIRYREIGLNKMDFKSADFEIKRMDYEASLGKEIFLSFENKDDSIIAGFLRLRIPGKSHRKEIDSKTALIRELHIYGQELDVGKRETKKAQHKGLGRELLEMAEKIAKEEFGKTKMVIIAGTGVREYYFKLGYKRAGPYVKKNL
ncbi:MAG: tRNA uridine(34) 5-carboxymethylaminomethyl modification radical SAM/GNAT enzyme Elp3 [Candidatus Micrarchaeota archaeon]